jgi:hypothetical protein
MRAWIIVLVVLLVAASVAMAAGKESAAPTCPSPGQAAGPAGAGMAETAAPQPEEIVAGGMVILRLRATVAGRTPSQRAGILYERLNGIVSDRTLKPGDYRAMQKGKDWMVMAGSHLFVTVTDEEAKANKAKPTQLAATWAQNLRKAVAAARPIPLPWEE